MRPAHAWFQGILRIATLFVAVHNFDPSRWCCRGYEVVGIKVHQVPLRQSEKNTPYCLAVSSALDVMNAPATGPSGPINFLATQVWPSARVAATALTRHMEPPWTVCEFGCGPGLPALTAAALEAKKVYATDLDSFALQLVEEAGRLQCLDNIETLQVDLCTTNAITIDNKETDECTAGQLVIPRADLYLFSDVFESSAVAMGAARVTRTILSEATQSRVWVFAQSDRVCREIYLEEMKKDNNSPEDLSWQKLEDYDPNSPQKLLMCDLDETTVTYG